ncbi:hypothetical protein IT400_02970, partial [Candidatus Nomurabacteria bacterium]|nr:hypothetical protein [Candidatus Nomurabacteria bacterium]
MVFLGSFSYASAADRYWVTGGTGNWNSTSNWASTSGGGSGVSIPTNTDNCYFDANSGSGTSTINASSACADLNFTGFTGTIAGSSALEVKGSFTAVQTMTWTYTGAITFTSTSTGKNIAFAGSAETFSYKRTITINHTEVINTDQTDFPILISGTYSYLKTVANGGNVQNANGYDIGFYSDSSLTTKLKWETERYVATTGEVIYW